MKASHKSILVLPLFVLAGIQQPAAQEKEVVREMVRLKYYNDSNHVQYLLIESLLRKGRNVEPQQNKTYELYLNSIESDDLIATVVTDETGRAKSFLPPSLTDTWNAHAQHTFLAVEPGEEDAATELEITKARISIDTASTEEGIRHIIVQVMTYESGEWLPAEDVELIVGIQRLGGVLDAGEDETYTTGPDGTVTVELSKDSLPGDENGHIVLVAKTEEDDRFGNLRMTRTVPWGRIVPPDDTFFRQRTLWATKFHTPIWLLFMAYSLVIGAWGTIIYLVFQIIRIKKLGQYSSATTETGQPLRRG